MGVGRSGAWSVYGTLPASERTADAGGVAHVCMVPEANGGCRSYPESDRSCELCVPERKKVLRKEEEKVDYGT